MNSHLQKIAGFALVAALCACAPARMVREPLPALSAQELAQAQAQQQARETAIAAMPDWALQGRVALSNGRNGGSGGIEWSQRGANYEVALSAPVTRQSWRLSGDAGSARIEGLEGGPRSGSDAQTLLRETTGWEIPVAALSSWVRGARADEGAFGAATLSYAADGRLARLEQGGWTVDYNAWQAAGETGAALPTRLNAERGQARVRLVVDRWEGAAAP
ncbi:outer membrane lipoprotein LolB [Luteimonas gilva]|uniref:Outer-membrane lipoprotein LolB n=1 Tax=Luteimonas gilva TaxID=2572684 RepID=A0A4U5JXV1_9GAMM|nr:lipoprotein insertase outer membrane protein LolB [Luteimonas gilva]TKR34016.1 outer membrane lipoprotein LolB [Luteimonas gilva]